MDADGNGEKSTTTFRWINVARYAVASVVTVLIATVVVIAIKTILRPDPLAVYVVGGSISVTPPEAATKEIELVVKVGFNNPSGRAVMYYYNPMLYLFDKNTPATTPNPQRDSFVALILPNKTVQQHRLLTSTTQVPVERDNFTPPSYFDMLYNNRSARIDDVTMLIEGYLVTEAFSGYNTTAIWTTYYCSSLVVVGWGQYDHDDYDYDNNMQGSVPCAAVQD